MRRKKLSEATGNELTVMKENMVFMSSIKQSIEEEENTHDDALKKLDTVKGVKANVQHLPRVKKIGFFEYLSGLENAVGKLVKKENFIF